MASELGEYDEQQLEAIYRKYAETKGWSTTDEAIQSRVQAWMQRSLGPVGLAIEFHETGIDPKPEIVDRVKRYSPPQSFIPGKATSEAGGNDGTNTAINDIYHYWVEVAGLAHRNADGTSRTDIVEKCHVGERLALKHEPDNPHDSNAINVKRKTGEQIGYLPRGLAEEINAKRAARRQYLVLMDQIRDEGVRISAGGSSKMLRVRLLIVAAESHVSKDRILAYTRELRGSEGTA